MRVKARAVVFVDGRLVLARETRQGRTHLSLPGGRVREREAVEEAVAREVAEETGVAVAVGPLLYVAEVRDARVHDLNLVFAATAERLPADGALALLDLSREPWPVVMPPLLERIAADRAAGWSAAPRWLGNVRALPDRGQADG